MGGAHPHYPWPTGGVSNNTPRSLSFSTVVHITNGHQSKGRGGDSLLLTSKYTLCGLQSPRALTLFLRRRLSLLCHHCLHRQLDQGTSSCSFILSPYIRHLLGLQGTS